MAAANSDQENVLLSSDDGSPNTPPPARRLPFKAAVAVGLCVFAAGLAGAVMIGRPAARAPTKIWHRWSATGLNEGEDEGTTTREPWEQYLSEECHHSLVKLEKEAEKNGRKHSLDLDLDSAEDLDCKESEQACTLSLHMRHVDCKESEAAQFNMSCTVSFDFAKCFPAECKQENIFKGLEEGFDPSVAVTGLKVSCSGADTPLPSAECPEDTPAIRISNHEDDDYNGVYHLKKPLNNKPHYVKDKKFHLYYWVNEEDDDDAVYQLDDRHQDGVKDQWRGGMQSDPRSTGLIPSGEQQWELDDDSEFAINIECMDE